MSIEKKKPSPSWRDVKTKLANYDRRALIDLVHDLYTASKHNQNFLHTRLALGYDMLKTY